MPEVVEKIAEARRAVDRAHLKVQIEVDGGISEETIARVVKSGADLLVAGNAVFGQGNAEENARRLLHAARVAAGEDSGQPLAKSGKKAIILEPPENRRPPAAKGKRNGLLRVKSQ